MSPTAYIIANITVIVILFATVIITNYSKKKKETGKVDILEYLASYSDRIIVIAEQVAENMKLTQSDYEKNPIEIKKKMLDEIVDTITSAANELGIDLGIIGKIDHALLVEAIYTLIEEKLPAILASQEENAKKTEEVLPDTTTTSNTTNISGALNNFYSESTPSDEV